MAVKQATGCICTMIHFSIYTKRGKKTKACNKDFIFTTKHTCLTTNTTNVTCNRCMGTVQFVRAYYHLPV